MSRDFIKMSTDQINRVVDLESKVRNYEMIIRRIAFAQTTQTRDRIVGQATDLVNRLSSTKDSVLRKSTND